MLKIAVVMSMDSERGKIGSWPCGLALFVESPTPSPICSPALQLPSLSLTLFHTQVPILLAELQPTRAQGARLGDSMQGYSMGDTLQILQRLGE